MVEGMSKESTSARLSEAEEILLAKQIEAGVLAAGLLEAAGSADCGASVADPSDGAAASHPPREEELRALVRQGEEAKERLALANLGLVRVIVADLAARSWTNRADLFQEGCLALEQVIRRYDYTRGRFGSFAGPSIRGHLYDVAFPPRREIAVGSDVGGDQVVEVTDDVHDALDRGVKRLPGPEGNVVRLRHGWGGGQPATLNQVAAWLDVSVAKVRRLERRGLDLLRADWLAVPA